ncbi:MAG TPA: hypothetical protein VLS96_12060, partial [Nodosilinea sp.]|nr:hypothetical protein [Nodosilinea sp.]
AQDELTLAAPAVAPMVTLPAVSPRQACFAATETVVASAAVGRISADTIAAYPPGIPAIVAGEVIEAGAIAQLAAVKDQGGYITGGSAPGTFRVLVPARISGSPPAHTSSSPPAHTSNSPPARP